MICPKCGRKIKGNYCSECRIYLVSGERTEEIRRAEPKQRESGWRDGALADDSFHGRQERAEITEKEREQREESARELSRHSGRDWEYRRSVKRERQSESSAGRERGRSRARKEPDTQEKREGYKSLKKSGKASEKAKKKKAKLPSLSLPRLHLPGGLAKFCSRASQLFCALLMLWLAFHALPGLWTGREGLGSIRVLITERNVSLASYLALSGGYLFFTCISALWIMTKRHFASGDKVVSADLGRGFTAFLLLAAISWAAPRAELFLEGQALLAGTERFLDIMLPEAETILKVSVWGLFLCVPRRFLKV